MQIPRSVKGMPILPSSVNGKLITVAYFLVFLVKHDAWNEFGEGNKVMFPIRIVHQDTAMIQAAV